MTSKQLTATLAAIGALISLPALAQEAYTTRIEPRAYAGAIVTMEAGVRVFRPMPPTRHVIVNPEGRTPLSLSEVRVYEGQGRRHRDPRRSSDY